MSNELKWLLVDLNSFFASCEQQDHPHLRGKPVAVVPMLADGTSVIAASYEAKKFGIKTGTRVFEAKKMCPGIQFVSGGHKKYVEYHHKIVAAVDEICPVEKVLSIDEMACRLIGRECQYDNAIAIAQRIKQNILDKVGECLTTSVGLGPNVLIAKMASDMQKPNGLVAVPAEAIIEKMGSLDIDAISGVGSQMKYRLNSKGFFKVQDLLKVSEHELRKAWGSVWGMRIAQELRGIDMAWKRNDSSSYSHEHVLPPDLRTTLGAYQILMKLLSKGCMRLRKNQRKAQSLGIAIRYFDQSRFEKTIQFQETDDTAYLIRELRKMFPRYEKKKPMKVSVFLSGLTAAGQGQLSFFDDPKREKINQAMDAINGKFGANTLVSGVVLGVTGQAKVRISFNHIPSKDDEF